MPESIISGSATYDAKAAVVPASAAISMATWMVLDGGNAFGARQDRGRRGSARTIASLMTLKRHHLTKTETVIIATI